MSRKVRQSMERISARKLHSREETKRTARKPRSLSRNSATTLRFLDSRSSRASRLSTPPVSAARTFYKVVGR